MEVIIIRMENASKENLQIDEVEVISTYGKRKKVLHSYTLSSIKLKRNKPVLRFWL